MKSFFSGLVGLVVSLLVPVVLLSVVACTMAPPPPAAKPHCIIPQRQPLPVITKEQLAVLPDKTYWALQERESRLVDWGMNQQAILKVLCEDVTPNKEPVVIPLKQPEPTSQK